MHAGREATVAIHRRDFGLDLRQHVRGLAGAAHHDDRRDRVVFLVVAPYTQSRHVANRHLGDVFHHERHAVALAQHDVLDVVEAITARQVVLAAVVYQPDPADVDRLLTNADLAPAHVDVGVGERAHDLRHGDAIGLELARVGRNLELLGGTTPAVDLHDARNGQQPAP